MGFVLFVRFAVLKCVDVLAWPLFPLGYPLCASVRAIESGLTSETEKLVTYWILLSLILLFEHAFAFLLKWLPGWSYVKLSAILWLAIPNFDRAFYIYHLLVHLCLSFDAKKILENVRNQMRSSTKSENFPDAAKRYLEENGPEALERVLLAQKLKHSGLAVDAQKEIRGEATGSKEAASAESAKPIFAQTETGSEVTDGEEVATHEQPKCCGQPDVDHQKEIRAEVLSTKGPVASEWVPHSLHSQATIPELERSENSRKTIAIDLTERKGTSTESTACKDKVKKEWTCALCQITVSGEQDLLAHVQGREHKSVGRELKQEASSPNMGSWASTSEAPDQWRGDTKSNSSTDGSQGKRTRKLRARKRGARVQNQENNPGKKASKSRSAVWCDICQMRVSSETNMASHLNGRKHLAQVQLQTASAPHGQF